MKVLARKIILVFSMMARTVKSDVPLPVKNIDVESPAKAFRYRNMAPILAVKLLCRSTKRTKRARRLRPKWKKGGVAGFNQLANPH